MTLACHAAWLFIFLALARFGGALGARLYDYLSAL